MGLAMKKLILKIWRENKTFIVFLSLMLLFRSAVADWNTVPTGSMKPTIEVGDRIWVNKLAYDLRVPFTSISLYRVSDPVRGDIVVFDSAVSDIRLVKRVVGVPGDVVEMRDNRVYINGESLSYSSVKITDEFAELRENLVGVEHRVRVHSKPSTYANFEPVRVPSDQYLVLGDNRDNSADSRAIGFVPRNEMIGRARHVVLSFNYDNFYIPRTERVLEPLDSQEGSKVSPSAEPEA